MGNFTDSQILILVLIATSNIILIIVAFVLLFSGKQTKRAIPEKNEKVISTPKSHEIISKKVQEPKREIEQVKKEIIKEEEPIINEVEDTNYDNIDYENYSVDEYSDEEYKYATIEEFENAQEENAIISYRELMKLKDNTEIQDIKQAVTQEPKKYSNTNYGTGEFISPVFGRVSNEYEYAKQPKPIERHERTRYNSAPERRANINVDSNIEFLNALKEFRNNL